MSFFISSSASSPHFCHHVLSGMCLLFVSTDPILVPAAIIRSCLDSCGLPFCVSVLLVTRTIRCSVSYFSFRDVKGFMKKVLTWANPQVGWKEIGSVRPSVQLLISHCPAGEAEEETRKAAFTPAAPSVFTASSCSSRSLGEVASCPCQGDMELPSV